MDVIRKLEKIAHFNLLSPCLSRGRLYLLLILKKETFPVKSFIRTIFYLYPSRIFDWRTHFTRNFIRVALYILKLKSRETRVIQCVCI